MDKAVLVVFLQEKRRDATGKAAAKELDAKLDKAQYECAESLNQLRGMLPELMILGGHWVGSMASVVMMRVLEIVRGDSVRDAIVAPQTELIVLMHQSVNPDGELPDAEMEERVRPWFQTLPIDRMAETFERLTPNLPNGYAADRAASIRRLADSS